jgi:hypothetical protein
MRMPQAQGVHGFIIKGKNLLPMVGAFRAWLKVNPLTRFRSIHDFPHKNFIVLPG